MRFLVTGAAGFLGSRFTALLRDRGHDVVPVVRPHGRTRAAEHDPDAVPVDAADPAARELIAGCDAVLHFAGVPDPGTARANPGAAIRLNVATTLNLLDGCQAHGAGLIYPSTVRAAAQPPPDAYAFSKWLGEEACRLHTARATVVRLTSVFGPGQVTWEGATGAIAAFAARAIEGQAIVIPGNPERARDFVYVDDVVPVFERIVADARWNESLTLASGASTPLIRAAELARSAARSTSSISTPGGDLPAGENESYAAGATSPGLDFSPRPLEQAVESYVDWLSRHPAAKERARA